MIDTTTTRPQSIFAKHETKAFPYQYAATIHVETIAGGVPSDEHVAEAYLRTKLAAKDDLIREAVAQTMVERGITADEAVKLVDIKKHLNGFKRDEHGLYIEGRQLKAALKEAVSVAVAAGKIAPPNGAKGWGKTNKGLLGFMAEHVFVVDERLHLGVTEATGIVQRFISSFRGTGIQYEEYVENAEFNCTIIADYLFTEEHWALIWLTGQQQGIGASRSQGFGKYVVTRWERIA